MGGSGNSCCPFYSGGGGGGGLYGGGGGGYAGTGPASGGGGGSSLIPAGGSFALADGPAQLVISTDFRLDVAKTGEGSVSSRPAGVNCGAVCAAAFPGGSVVTLDAEPVPGNGFVSWGGACAGAAPTCAVTMDRARAVTASFENVPPVITELEVDPFVASRDDTPLERALGTDVKLKLSEDARVSFRVRSDPVRKESGPPPRRVRKFTRDLKLGRSTVPFTGTLGGRTFAPGRYVLVVRARDGELKSERVRTGFRIER